MKFLTYMGIAALFALVAGCGRGGQSAKDGVLRVVVTTTIIGDVVANVGGEAMDLHVLIPPGSDPHHAVFRPADLALTADADIVFVNGGRLEGQVERLLRNVGDPRRIVSLDRNIAVRCDASGDPHHHHHHHDHAHDHGGIDPHFWTDPHNVMIWTETIAEALAERQPEEADAFRARAAAYQQQLQELDAWIQEQVARIPEKNRQLVTDHLSLGYFADRYGFEQVGVILPSFDTMAQPAARDLAALIQTIRAQDVPALFIGAAMNPALAGQIARDTGTQLVVLPSGSLTSADGLAPDYLSYMRTLVDALVDNLARSVH